MLGLRQMRRPRRAGCYGADLVGDPTRNILAILGGGFVRPAEAVAQGTQRARTNASEQATHDN
jgi:hypothetical protein